MFHYKSYNCAISMYVVTRSINQSKTLEMSDNINNRHVLPKIDMN